MIKLIVKKPLLIGAFFMFIIGVGGFLTNFSNKIEFSKLNKVKLVIVEEPSNCINISNRTSFVKLSYKGKFFNKKIGKWYCKHIGQEYIYAKINKDKTKVFFLNKDFKGQIVSSLFLLLAGLLIGYISYKKK